MGAFVMPSLGADMEAATLVEWLVKPGDTVHRGDVVAVVETQKGAIEIEIFRDGTVTELLAEVGQELPVGAPLATVQAKGETTPDAKAEPTAAPKPAPAAAIVEPDTKPEPSQPAELPRQPDLSGEDAAAPPPPLPGMHHASPAARKMAEKLGIDLSTLQGSGPNGAILLADVETAAQSTPRPRAAPMVEMRKAIAAAMTRAKQTIPHFYLSETIDVEPAIAFLDARNAGVPPSERILLGALFVRATALAAGKVREMNGHFTEDRGFVASEAVNAGVAIALRGGGLVAPALMDAAFLSLEATMKGMRDLVTRARAGRLRGSEMTQGTITISSLGEAGAEAMTGVIFPPQVALVGIGAPHLRPWVVDAAVVPRRVVTLTISADHRVSDGRQVSRFIAEFENLMQRPEEL